MKNTSKAAHAGLSPLIPAVLAPPEVLVLAPHGFIPPPLNPTGARLETKELAPGVYGLLSSKPPVDNSGFVVGKHGVLVIDAHINGAMAGLIQTAVRQVTNKPILYVVNTNYHGDHTFGNSAFPQETLIVAQQKTAAIMRDFRVWEAAEQKTGLRVCPARSLGKMSQIKHILPDRLSARLYPFEMARKYNNPGNLSIHNVFKLSCSENVGSC
jgi:glyoxylase-like metal-dependent hydrolase (beta-lactamase superfamily II)